MELSNLMKEHVFEFISRRTMVTREGLLDFVFEALDDALNDMLASNRIELVAAESGTSHLDEFRLSSDRSTAEK